MKVKYRRTPSINSAKDYQKGNKARPKTAKCYSFKNIASILQRKYNSISRYYQKIQVKQKNRESKPNSQSTLYKFVKRSSQKQKQKVGFSSKDNQIKKIIKHNSVKKTPQYTITEYISQFFNQKQTVSNKVLPYNLQKQFYVPKLINHYKSQKNDLQIKKINKNYIKSEQNQKKLNEKDQLIDRWSNGDQSLITLDCFKE